MWHICCFSPRSEQPRHLFQPPLTQNFTPEDKVIYAFKKLHRVIAIPPQSVSCNYLRWGDHITTHKVPYYYFDVLLVFGCLHLPKFCCTPVFLVCTSMVFLPAYAGSLALVPKDSKIVLLCVLVCFMIHCCLYYSVSALKWPCQCCCLSAFQKVPD